VLEGYRDFVVQDLIVKSNNTRYRRAVYRLPDGTLRVAQRPADISSHFRLGLQQYVLLQVHQNHVTQNRLLEQLLKYPHLPLHNNLSENDIREYARLRKSSGGTRSETGRRCRDTFMSLKKTCRMLGVRFSSYLRDRPSNAKSVPRLVELMAVKAKLASGAISPEPG